MKTLPRSLALVAFGAVMLYGIGIAAAGAPAAAHGPCPDCPMAAGDNAAAPPMMEKMKAHLEGMKSAVAALRASEKKLEGTEDPKAFRAAVIEHLKTLDDVEAAHLAHMESMAGHMHEGMPGMMHHGKCECGKDCPCKDCMGRDCRHKDGCPCRCGCHGDGGHKH